MNNIGLSASDREEAAIKQSNSIRYGSKAGHTVCKAPCISLALSHKSHAFGRDPGQGSYLANATSPRPVESCDVMQPSVYSKSKRAVQSGLDRTPSNLNLLGQCDMSEAIEYQLQLALLVREPAVPNSTLFLIQCPTFDQDPQGHYRGNRVPFGKHPRMNRAGVVGSPSVSTSMDL